MKKLDGDVLLGFSDFFEPGLIETTGSVPAPTQGLKVLGQVPPPPSRAIPAAPSSGGKTPPPPKRADRRPPTDFKKVSTKPKAAREYQPVKQTTVMMDHGKIMKKARNTMSKAVYALTGKKPPELAKDKRIKGTDLKTAVVKGIASTTLTAPPSAKATTLRRGAGRVVMGTYEELVALGVAPKKVSPVAQAKLDAAKRKLEAATRKSNELKKQLGAKTKALLPTVRNLAKATVQQKKISRALRTPGRTAVGQDPSSADPTLTDPMLTDPTLTDPSLAAMDTGVSDADILDLLDSGAITPQKYGPDQFFEDYKAVNGILYKGEKGRPNGYVLSYGLLTRKSDMDKTDPDSWQIDGANHYGFVWGVYEKDNREKGIRWGEVLAPDKWNWVHGANHLGWDKDWHEVVEESFVLEKTPNLKAGQLNTKGSRGQPSPGVEIKPDQYIGEPYGPLVGNDAYPEFKGMRVDSKGNMFWLPWEAPDWLTAPIRQAAQVTKALEEKARKEAEAASKLRDQLDAQERDRQKAAADFERAQQEAAAESEQKITTAKAEGEAATALVEEQKTATEQAKLDIEQQREMFKQQMAMMEEERRLMAMQAMQPPQPYAYSEADEAYPGEPYGEYEPEAPMYDDGMSVPGGDIMRDEGGAGYGQFEDMLEE